MKLDKFLIGLLLMSCVVIVGVMMLNDADEQYYEFNVSSTENDSFMVVYNNVTLMVEDTIDTGIDVKNKTLGGEIDDTDTWESMLKGSYSAIRLVAGSFGLISAIFNTLNEQIGIPRIFTDMAFAAIIISIIFSIIYLVFRTN